MLTAYHAKYYAHELTRRHAANGVDRLSQSLFDASVDLNPHQIDAALFALSNPLQQGVLLADEVGLGKTIEASLVICQLWAERRRRLIIIAPASLRKQWAQELLEKFAVPTTVLDAVALRKQSSGTALETLQRLVGKSVLILSYQFAARLETELRAIPWDVAVIDEAHKLRNAHKTTNRIGQALRRALEGRKKILLTATPLQNSLMELYGLSTLIDEHLFGDEKAFRKNYLNNPDGHEELRARLSGFAKRTLRKDVLEYIKYTERKAITQPFNPTDAEHAVYERISAFLLREESFALPKKQRHLTGLILRKLLASSTPAILGTLLTIKRRLEKMLEDDAAVNESLIEQLVEEDDLETDYLEEDALDSEQDTELENTQPAHAPDANQRKRLINEEILELDHIIALAQDLTNDTKAQALLTALELGFNNMATLGAPKKAIIFTESKRTQEYLYQFLSSAGFKDKLVLFSGTNNYPDSTQIYQQWLIDYKGTDRVTGSPQVDRRTALIDHFRKQSGGADIMIATEAAAEGVNLQFCALLINYDLPWNPQRVEQRIGRCHRYGQRFDVVVINFLNTRNQADQRVLELLSEKFSLFSGIFGASDEVLGSVESGIDFEKRILSIYERCRHPDDIEQAFNALQAELEASIQERIASTQNQLLENFDEDVHDRLKLRLDEAEARLDKLGRWFWGASQYALAPYAQFESKQPIFTLQQLPPSVTAPTGRYQLVRGKSQTDLFAHAYRLSHPLGEWVLQHSLAAATPTASVCFDYSKHGSKISQIEALVGQSGWLQLTHLQITAFETSEYLLFTGISDSGQLLDQELCEKLMGIAASKAPAAIDMTAPAALLANSERQVAATIAHAVDTNQRLFNEEREKLEKWAEDKLFAAEENLRNTKAKIAQLKRDARKAETMQEQAAIQKELAELERSQRKQRQEIFDVEDEIIEKRDELIDSLQQRMQEKTETQILFTLHWQVV